ncbi:MAG: DEAD/DEAH box helicase family protein [Methanobacteriaceae archaeon]|nr:DEAD/DEAH box helicase family protein [Methanobacteriaceae archaeon]
MLKEGMTVSGPFWPEPIEIKKIEKLGDNTLIIGSTFQSNQLFENLLDDEDLKKLVIDDFVIDFSSPASEVFLSLEAQRYRYTSMFDTFLAMNTSKIDPLPFQLDAVYLHALKQPKMRFMIADDPGAGKTIMAGLIIKELKLRGLAQKILIVSPGHLTSQWQREMKEKFNESFRTVNRSYINSYSLENAWDVENQYITSIDFAKQQDIRAMLSGTKWDLVVVDEAHKMSAYMYGKKISKRQRYRLGEVLSRTTEHMLFLTATPHQGDPENYLLLLDLLIPGFFADPAMINEARRNGDNPLFIRRIKEDLRDFDLKPIFTKRSTTTVKFDLNEQEIQLYEDLSRYVQTQFNRAIMRDKRVGFSFALLILQRRMASSIYALLKSLERKKASFEEIIKNPDLLKKYQTIDEKDLEDESEEDRWIMESEWEKKTTVDTIVALKAEIETLDHLITLANSILAERNETKLSKLREVMNSLGDEKILIFTEAKDTLNYLVKKIGSWGYEVNTIHGGMSMDERVQAERVFKEQTQVMVATEAAGEGINLQFCHLMINYDIPWNPNRLEQRMGRIHRYKQKKDVHIFNFVAENTREGAVLATILDKLNEIKKSIGSDKVFDVIGDIFQGKDLYNLIAEAVSGERSVVDIQDELDFEVDGEYRERLKKELLDQGLVDNIDYESIFDLSEINAELSLVPEYLEEFFKKAFVKANGRYNIRKDGTIQIRTVPREIRKINGRNSFKKNYGNIKKTYTSITFNRDHANNGTELVTFGHPLLEGLIEWVEESFYEKMRKGCTFEDPLGEYDGYFWFYEGTVKDGKDKIVGKRLFAVYDNGYEIKKIDPSVLWNLEPIDDPKPSNVHLDMEKTKIYVIELVKNYLKELKVERERQANVKKKYGIKSLEQLITEIDKDLTELYMRSDVGEDVDLAIYNKETKKKEYESSLNKLNKEIIQERSLSISLPKFIATIKVKSNDINKLNNSKINKVLDYEISEGREPQLSPSSLGFNIKSKEEDKFRFISFKYLNDTESEITLTLNEWLKAKRFGESYWLYILAEKNNSYELFLIQNPVNKIAISKENLTVNIMPEMCKLCNKVIEIMK